MRELLDTLNQNAGAFNVLFGGVVMLATAVYAVLTAVLVVETRKMRRAQTEAEVVVRLQPSEKWINLIELVVENVGMGTAYDITLKATTDQEYEPGKRLSDLGLFKHGIRVLSPRQSLKTFLMSIVGKVDKIKDPSGPLRFTIVTRYRNVLGEPMERTFELDLQYLLGLRQAGTPPLEKLADSIENIQKDLAHLASGFRRLKVVTYTKNDIEEETARIEARMLEQKRVRQSPDAVEQADEGARPVDGA